MKLVVAIIRPDRLNHVLEELFQAKVAGLTISRVQGHGGETERVATYRGTTVKMELTEKVRLEIGVSDHFAAVTLAKLAQTVGRGSAVHRRRFLDFPGALKLFPLAITSRSRALSARAP